MDVAALRYIATERRAELDTIRTAYTRGRQRYAWQTM